MGSYANVMRVFFLLPGNQVDIHCEVQIEQFSLGYFYLFLTSNFMDYFKTVLSQQHGLKKIYLWIKETSNFNKLLVF